MTFTKQEGTINFMKIIPKTKPVSVTIIMNNDYKNFETFREFKWNMFGFKEWDMTLPILKKKRVANENELLKTLGLRYDELKS